VALRNEKDLMADLGLSEEQVEDVLRVLKLTYDVELPFPKTVGEMLRVFTARTTGERYDSLEDLASAAALEAFDIEVPPPELEVEGEEADAPEWAFALDPFAPSPSPPKNDALGQMLQAVLRKATADSYREPSPAA